MAKIEVIQPEIVTATSISAYDKLLAGKTPIATYDDKNRFGHNYGWLLKQADLIKMQNKKDEYLKELYKANRIYEAGVDNNSYHLQAEGACKAYAYYQFYVKKNPNYLTPILSGAYKEYPLDVKTFVEDPFYLGDTGLNVWSNIMLKLQEMNRYPFTTDVGVREVLMGGAVGIGKSFQAAISCLYTIYILHCLEDISVLYPSRSSKRLSLFLSAIDLAQLKSQTFDLVMGCFDASPFFKEFGKRNTRKSSELEMDSINTTAYPVIANRSKYVGHDALWAFIDELNQMDIIESSIKNKGDGGGGSMYDQADVLVSELLTRIDSRFVGRADKPIPKIGSVMQGSSANYIGDFLDKKFNKQEEEQNPAIVAMKLKLWEAKPKEDYCGETFKFLIGTSEIEPRILDTSCVEGIHYPYGSEIDDVPIEHYPIFAKDPTKGQREFMGRPTSTSNKLFQNQTIILQSVNAYNDYIRQNMEIRQALKKGAVSFWDSKKDSVAIQRCAEDAGVSEEYYMKSDLHIGYLLRDNVDYKNHGMLAVNLNYLPHDLDTPRYIHIDMSSTGDRTGIACVKINGNKVNGSGEVVPTFVVEFAASIQPSKEAPIEPSVVRRFVQDLKSVYGLNIYKVTYDGVSSPESIELLKKNGIDSEYFSCDRTMNAYVYLKDAMADGRVLLHNNPILSKELVNLEMTKVGGHEKYDHPKGSGHSKDISDCVASAIYVASKARATRAGLGFDSPRRREVSRRKANRRSVR